MLREESHIPGLVAAERLHDQEVLSRANYMHSDAASQGGGWWQGCGAAYVPLVVLLVAVDPLRLRARRQNPSVSYRCSIDTYEKYGMRATVSRKKKRSIGGRSSKMPSMSLHSWTYGTRMRSGVSGGIPPRACSRLRMFALLSFSERSVARLRLHFW